MRQRENPLFLGRTLSYRADSRLRCRTKETWRGPFDTGVSLDLSSQKPSSKYLCLLLHGCCTVGDTKSGQDDTIVPVCVSLYVQHESVGQRKTDRFLLMESFRTTVQLGGEAIPPPPEAVFASGSAPPEPASPQCEQQGRSRRVFLQSDFSQLDPLRSYLLVLQLYEPSAALDPSFRACPPPPRALPFTLRGGAEAADWAREKAARAATRRRARTTSAAAAAAGRAAVTGVGGMGGGGGGIGGGSGGLSGSGSSCGTPTSAAHAWGGGGNGNGNGGSGSGRGGRSRQSLSRAALAAEQQEREAGTSSAGAAGAGVGGWQTQQQTEQQQQQTEQQQPFLAPWAPRCFAGAPTAAPAPQSEITRLNRMAHPRHCDLGSVITRGFAGVLFRPQRWNAVPLNGTDRPRPTVSPPPPPPLLAAAAPPASLPSDLRQWEQGWMAQGRYNMVLRTRRSSGSRRQRADADTLLLLHFDVEWATAAPEPPHPLYDTQPPCSPSASASPSPSPTGGDCHQSTHSHSNNNSDGDSDYDGDGGGDGGGGGDAEWRGGGGGGSHSPTVSVGSHPPHPPSTGEDTPSITASASLATTDAATDAAAAAAASTHGNSGGDGSGGGGSSSRRGGGGGGSRSRSRGAKGTGSSSSRSRHRGGGGGGSGGGGTSSGLTDQQKMCHLPITFHYVCSDDSDRRTELRHDFRCPWCTLPCDSLLGLVAHLTCSHDRFFYCYTEDANGYPGLVATPNIAREDDSSWATPFFYVKPLPPPPASNSRSALRGSGSGSSGKSGSSRQQQQRHRRSPPPPPPGVNRPPLWAKRHYYHSRTGQRVSLPELEVDSDDDLEGDWIRKQGEKLMDEFDDVAVEEKEMMKLWNAFVASYRIFGQRDLPKAAILFTHTHADRINSLGLRPNFVLHLFNLWDHCQLSHTTVALAVAILDAHAAHSTGGNRHAIGTRLPGAAAAAAAAASSTCTTQPCSSSSSSLAAGGCAAADGTAAAERRRLPQREACSGTAKRARGMAGSSGEEGGSGEGGSGEGGSGEGGGTGDGACEHRVWLDVALSLDWYTSHLQYPQPPPLTASRSCSASAPLTPRSAPPPPPEEEGAAATAAAATARLRA